MKLTQIAVAVAALAAAPAFAAVGTLNVLYGVSDANIVYVSGASALSASLEAVVFSKCKAPGVTVELKLTKVGSVSTAAAGSTSDGRVIVCTAGSTDGAFSAPFAVIKRDTDGSFAGVGPVISQTALKKWGNKSVCDSVTKQCEIDSTTDIIPHAGLSDVDTNVWRGLANTTALSATNAALLNPAVAKPTSFNAGFAGQGFAVMVSEKLYRAMQTKQITEGRLPTTGCDAVSDAAYTAGKCQPSISKEEYAAFVGSSDGAYFLNGALSGDANPINLCRRVETSGTQAVSNVYFLNNSCANANPTKGFRAPLKAGDSGLGVVVFDSSAGHNVTGNYDDFGGAFGVFEGSGTGDARNCVINRNNGQNPNKAADSLGNYAIGWISLENTPATGWKLIKLDGISPNAVADSTTATGWTLDAKQRTNVVKSYYDVSPEFEFLWPSANISTASYTHPANFKTFLGSLKTAFATPGTVNLTGIFQANAGSPTSIHASFPTQVHKGTRNGNFCSPQVLAE